MTGRPPSLVAAKTFYFGVGGGTRAFEQAVLEDGRFTSEVVLAIRQGQCRPCLLEGMEGAFCGR